MLTGKDTTDFDRRKNDVDVERLVPSCKGIPLLKWTKCTQKMALLLLFSSYFYTHNFWYSTASNKVHSSCDFERYYDYYDDDAKKNYDATSTTTTATYMAPTNFNAFLPIHRVINQDSEDLYLCPFFSERRAYFVIWHTTAYYLGVLYICVI